MCTARLVFPAAKVSSPRLLALFISACCGSMAVPVYAATTTTATTTATAANTSTTAAPAATGGGAPAAVVGNGTETITVVAKPDNVFTPGGDRLVPAYLDGQIANGGRLGLLGEQSAQDVPFNVVGYYRQADAGSADALPDRCVTKRRLGANHLRLRQHPRVVPGTFIAKILLTAASMRPAAPICRYRRGGHR